MTRLALLFLFGFYAAAQPARLEGRMTNSVSGEPVRRVSLTLQPLGKGMAASVVSGPDGAFVIDNIQPGAYTLSAERAGFVDQTYGTRFELAAGGAIKDLNFKLTPHAVLAGKVVDDNNDPVAHVAVTAFKRIGGKLIRVNEADTNDLGEYRIAGLPAGKYLLAADRGVATFYPAADSVASAVEVLVAAGQDSFGRDIQLRSARTYSISGVAARGVSLTLFPVKDLGFDRPSAIATANGSFRLSNVPPGSYHLVATSTIGSPRVLGAMPLNVDGDIENLSIPLSEPSELRAVIRFEGKHAPSTVTMMLQPDGAPVMPPSAQMQRDGSVRVEGVSRLLYRLKFFGLPREAYVKSATVAGKDVLQDGLDLRAGAAGAVEVTIGMTAASLTGTVKDGDKDAVVIALPEPTRFDPMLYKKVSVTETGEFQIAGLAPGQYRLWALPEGAEIDPYADAEWIRSIGNASEPLTLRDSAGLSASLKVLAVDGR